MTEGNTPMKHLVKGSPALDFEKDDMFDDEWNLDWGSAIKTLITFNKIDLNKI